jgi:hypothetical protein
MKKVYFTLSGSIMKQFQQNISSGTMNAQLNAGDVDTGNYFIKG